MNDEAIFTDSNPLDLPDQDVSSFDAPELSPEEIADHIARTAANVLESTGLIEIKELESSVGQIHLFGRVKDSKKRAWALLVKKMLVVAKRNDIDEFIGTQNIVRLRPGAPVNSANEEDYEHRFGHVVSFGALDLKTAAEQICNVILDAFPSRRVEVTEAPMMGCGAPQSGGRVTGRKGAHPTSGSTR